MLQDILFLDKDQTLGDFVIEGCGLYSGTKSFLEAQKQLGRALYVATTAGEGGRRHLKDIDQFLSGYFGSGQIDVTVRDRLYVLPDGAIHKIYDDYKERKEFEPPEKRAALDRESQERGERFSKLPYGSVKRNSLQKEINAFFEYWGQLLHRETKVPFDPSTEYKNPYCKGSMKDLYLARKLISPQNYQDQRTVMVGDYGDSLGYASDPETPLVVISQKVREGKWDQVTRIVNYLFSDPENKPWQMFDALFEDNEGTKNKRKINFYKEDYKIEVNKHQGRIIYCP